MSMKPICIYHGGCDDGFGAAYAVWKKYGEGFEYYPGVYQNPPPDVTSREVVIVDFSYPKQTILKMAEVAERIRILDHHKSAEEDLIGFTYGQPTQIPNVEAIFIQSRSGAVIAWNYFHDIPTPTLLLHIQDRDLWQFKMPGTKEISMALRSYKQDFKTWDYLMSRPITELRCEGESINRWFNLRVEKLKRHVIRQNIGGFDVPTVNTPPMFASDLSGELAVGEPFAACYWDLPDGRVYSLRSRDNGIDVSEIAKQYGGGGHLHAAGFRIKHGKKL